MWFSIYIQKLVLNIWISQRKRDNLKFKTEWMNEWMCFCLRTFQTNFICIWECFIQAGVVQPTENREQIKCVSFKRTWNNRINRFDEIEKWMRASPDCLKGHVVNSNFIYKCRLKVLSLHKMSDNWHFHT